MTSNTERVFGAEEFSPADIQYDVMEEVLNGTPEEADDYVTAKYGTARPRQVIVGRKGQIFREFDCYTPRLLIFEMSSAVRVIPEPARPIPQASVSVKCAPPRAATAADFGVSEQSGRQRRMTACCQSRKCRCKK